MRFVVFWSDALVYLLLFGLFLWWLGFRNTTEWREIWNCICKRPRYLIALMILTVYGIIGILDTVHFKGISLGTVSVLDILVSPLGSQTETTYSAPFALYSYSSETVQTAEGTGEQVFPRLKYAGMHLTNPDRERARDIAFRVGKGLLIGFGLTAIFAILVAYYCHPRESGDPVKKTLKTMDSRFRGNDGIRAVTKQKLIKIQKTFWITFSSILVITSIIAMLFHEYHILGTDKVGRDVFYIAIKSIRTGLVIGTVTTLVMLPFALLFGMWAGYFRGWVDDVIQYIYTTLSSIPSVLLIAAAMLSLQIRVQENPDLRLVILCIILGITSWTTLCRLLRGETLKLRESGFVESAISLGTQNFNILRKHILPNLMHIVIITVVLDFSGLVLAEAVLSYVGVGVDPVSFSFGNMINASRLEMARDPIVWWSLLGALVLMFTLVFSANIFSDALQEALNPRKE